MHAKHLPERRAVAKSRAFQTKSGNTRFVRASTTPATECSTFTRGDRRDVLRGRGPARTHAASTSEQRNGFTNVYLDAVEPSARSGDGEAEHADEVAVDRRGDDDGAYLLPPRPSSSRFRRRSFFEKLQPFKELVAEDIEVAETTLAEALGAQRPQPEAAVVLVRRGDHGERVARARAR